MIKRNIEGIFENTIKHYPIALLELSAAITDPKIFLEMHLLPL